MDEADHVAVITDSKIKCSPIFAQKRNTLPWIPNVFFVVDARSVGLGCRVVWIILQLHFATKQSTMLFEVFNSPPKCNSMELAQFNTS